MKSIVYCIFGNMEGREGREGVPGGDLPRVILECEGDSPRTILGALEIEFRDTVSMRLNSLLLSI